MANALAIQIADAIVAEINGHAWTAAPDTVAANRRYLAIYEGDDLATLQIAVAPIERSDKNATREKQQSDHGIMIDVQKRVTTPPYTTEMDGLVNFVAELKDFYDDNHRLASPLEAFWIEAVELVDGNGRLWAADALYFDHAFEAALRLTVRGVH